MTVIGVIGPQTAKTATEFGLRVDVTSPKASVTALVDALAEFGAAQRCPPPERAPPRCPPPAALDKLDSRLVCANRKVGWFAPTGGTS